MSAAPSKIISELIRNLAVSETKVEYASPCPGRTSIKITGPTKEAVQHHIFRQFEIAERDDTLCQFQGPYQFASVGWIALGEVMSWAKP